MWTPSRGVVLEIVEVHQRGLAEVVVCELHVPDLGRDHGLRAGRERRVAHGDRLVVVEVARLLLVAEGVAAPVEREHEVGLLHDLLAVEVEVREVEQQRVAVARLLEVPELVVGEPLRLRVDAEQVVPGDDDVARRVAPGRRLLQVGPELGGAARVAGDGVGGGAEVLLREQVRVDVVVGDGAVLVGAGDAVDPEAAAGIVVPERAPEPRGLDQELEPDLPVERLVAGRGVVARDGVADVCVDVERRRAGGPVAGALLAADRPPRERRAARGRAGRRARARGRGSSGASAARRRRRRAPCR